MIEFDHAVVAVRDLDRAASRLFNDHGLASYPGGKHSGFGTANRIIPLGPAYIELMAVVDSEEAAGNPLGSWIARETTQGDRLAALCLRTDDIDAVARRLDTQPLPMARERPDGSVLSWRLAGLEKTLTDPSLPFFIQWEGGIDDFPGSSEVPHRVKPLGISYVEIGHDGGSLREWIGPSELDVRAVQGHGLLSVGIETDEGVVVLK